MGPTLEWKSMAVSQNTRSRQAMVPIIERLCLFLRVPVALNAFFVGLLGNPCMSYYFGRALLSPKTLTLNPKPYLWLRTGQSVLRIDEVCCYTEASAELQHGRLLNSSLVNLISQIGISTILSMFAKLHFVFCKIPYAST